MRRMGQTVPSNPTKQPRSLASTVQAFAAASSAGSRREFDARGVVFERHVIHRG
jgi:hypothetical protein